MMDNTNMLTVRVTRDGSKIVELNGREIPYVADITTQQLGKDLHTVTLQIEVSQVNVIEEANMGEDYTPVRSDTRRAALFTEVIAAIDQECKQELSRWWRPHRLAHRIGGIIGRTNGVAK